MFKTKEEQQAYNRAYYLKNRDKRIQSAALWIKANAGRAAVSRNRRIEEVPIQYLLTRVRNSAALRGIDFNLTASDISIPQVCPYLGIPLTNIRGQGRVGSNLSIDRIDNDKGYLPGNVQIISQKANSMKYTATTEELIAFAKGVLRLHART